MNRLVVWYQSEQASLTEYDRQRIRGMWISLPFTYPLVREFAFWLVENFF